MKRVSIAIMCLVYQAMNLLEKTLILDPEVRLTAKDGLSHPYLSEFHDPENEPESSPYDDSFESLELAVSEWKSENTHAHLHAQSVTSIYHPNWTRIKLHFPK